MAGQKANRLLCVDDRDPYQKSILPWSMRYLV